MVKKVKLHMKAHSSNTSVPIPIVGFLPTLKVSCDTSRVHEGADMVDFYFFVKSALATTKNV